MKKFLSVGIAILFVIMTVTPSTGFNDIEKHSSIYKYRDYNENYRNITGDTCNDGLYFYGQGNKSIYIVTVSSPNIIYINNFTYQTRLGIIGVKAITGASYSKCFCTNGTEYVRLPWGEGSGSYMGGSLRYLHFKIGRFSKTYDNRTVHNRSGYVAGSTIIFTNRTFPPGRWHFIFTGGLHEISQEETLINTSVWINFSDSCGDLEISTSEGGKVYSLWYGEFNANIIVSKADDLELMIRGRASFHINNTFMYTFGFNPSYNGFWHINWETPDGIRKFKRIMKRGYWFDSEDDEEGFIYGLDKSGDYKLSTSYLDYYPFNNSGHFSPVSFIGIDVKLP